MVYGKTILLGGSLLENTVLHVQFIFIAVVIVCLVHMVFEPKEKKDCCPTSSPSLAGGGARME